MTATCWPVSLVCLFTAASMCVSCDEYAASGGQPLHKVKCLADRGGYSDYGSTGAGIFGITIEPKTLRIWAWEARSLSASRDYDVELLSGIVPLAGNVVLAKRDPQDSYAPWPLVLVRADTGDVLHEWPTPKGWWIPHTGGSRNGKFAAFGFGEFPSGGYKIGFVTVATRELKWSKMRDGDGYYTVGQLAVSDDGAHVAVGGWNNCVAMIDMAGQSVRWVKRPPSAITMAYVAFSPDAETIYAGGGDGCVYGLDVQTGDVKSRWVASKSGKEAYGHRVACVAVSPDGRYVAAGTGPEGQVFVWDTKTGGKPRLFNHGMTRTWAVSFSPDSKYLATCAAMLIKTWDLAQ